MIPATSFPDNPAVVKAGSEVAGRKRHREEDKEQIEVYAWMIPIIQDLPFPVEYSFEQRKSYVRAARSKTVFFCGYPEKDSIRQINSRQYVLYIEKDVAVAHLSLIYAPLKAFLSSNYPTKMYSVIGFWRAQCWNNKVLILIDRDDISRKKDKNEPGAFDVVGLYQGKTSIDDGISYFEPDKIYSELRPFLNIVDNPSEPPEIAQNGRESLGRDRSYQCKIYENAKSYWEASFTKNVSVVTKTRFSAMTHIPDKSLSCLTRLSQVVEKEDWLKMAVFLSSDCDSIRSIAKNEPEFREAVSLTEEGVLHFSLMTMIDEYDLKLSKSPVVIIPAFRLWRYGFYMLFVRGTDGVFHRFFLAKHYAGDKLLFCYNPNIDSVGLFKISETTRVNEQFFYIVPRISVPFGTLYVFGSLTEVTNRVTKRD